jgi:hypothetical protein
MSLACKIQESLFPNGAQLPDTCGLELESSVSEGLKDSIPIYLIYFPVPNGGTEIESTLKLIETAQKGAVTSLSLQDALNFLSDQFKLTYQEAADKGMITLGSSGWNLFQLIKLGLDVKKGNYFENRKIVAATLPMTQPATEVLSDIQQQLARNSLKASELFIRVVKGATVMISDPLTGKLAQACIDSASHFVTLYRGMTTNDPELQRNPQIMTWKDTAHRVSMNILTTVSLSGSLFVIASSLDVVDDDSMTYSIATKGALASTVLNIGYGILQQIGIFAKRD